MWKFLLEKNKDECFMQGFAYDTTIKTCLQVNPTHKRKGNERKLDHDLNFAASLMAMLTTATVDTA
jgi:hypothetical protein